MSKPFELLAARKLLREIHEGKHSLPGTLRQIERHFERYPEAAARAEGCDSAGDPGDGGDTTPLERLIDCCEHIKHMLPIDLSDQLTEAIDDIAIAREVRERES